MELDQGVGWGLVQGLMGQTQDTVDVLCDSSLQGRIMRTLHIIQLEKGQVATLVSVSGLKRLTHLFWGNNAQQSGVANTRLKKETKESSESSSTALKRHQMSKSEGQTIVWLKTRRLFYGMSYFSPFSTKAEIMIYYSRETISRFTHSDEHC